MQAREGFTRVHIEEKGDIGEGLADGVAVDRARHGRIELAGNALVNLGRIVEAVADHHIAASQRGADDFANVLCAARSEKKQLGFRHEAVAFRCMLQKVAHTVPGGRASRLACGQAGVTGFAQPCGEPANLRGFAAALGAFESDK